MSNANDLGLNPTPSIMVVGDSGTHKTYFLTTIPGIFIFDFDKGMAIARGRDVEFQTFKDAPHGSKVTSKEHGIYPWGQAWPAFILRLNQLGETVDKGELRPIGLDSLTTLSDICMNYVLRETNSKGPPQIQHWGAQIELMKTVLDQMTAWPVLFAATAHVQRNTNEVTQIVEQLPLLTGKLAGKAGLYFDEVWFTQVKGKSATDRQFVLQTESYGMVKQAKTRYGVPDGLEATWQAVEKYFRG